MMRETVGQWWSCSSSFAAALWSEWRLPWWSLIISLWFSFFSFIKTKPKWKAVNGCQIQEMIFCFVSCKAPAQPAVRSSISITGTSQYILILSEFTSSMDWTWIDEVKLLIDYRTDRSHLHLQIPRERFYVTDRQWSSIRVSRSITVSY